MKQQPEWVKGFLVFVVFMLLDAAMIFAGVVASLLWGYDKAAAEIWLWIVAFPVSLAHSLFGLDEVTFPLLLLLNPLIYGAMALAVWWMEKRFRSKPAE